MGSPAWWQHITLWVRRSCFRGVQSNDVRCLVMQAKRQRSAVDSCAGLRGQDQACMGENKQERSRLRTKKSDLLLNSDPVLSLRGTGDFSSAAQALPCQRLRTLNAGSTPCTSCPHSQPSCTSMRTPDDDSSSTSAHSDHFQQRDCLHNLHHLCTEPPPTRLSLFIYDLAF